LLPQGRQGRRWTLSRGKVELSLVLLHWKRERSKASLLSLLQLSVK
jgi:hypothetical protein